LVTVALAQQARGAVGAIDRYVAAAEGLGKFGMEKLTTVIFAIAMPLPPALASRRLLH
jgi:hypothetical protein